MFAKNLEILLSNLCAKRDVSPAHDDEFAKRFNALRRFRRLPRGRHNRAKRLSNSEIASAILGLSASEPGWAGHAALILSNLRPVGGGSASFFATETLQSSIERILNGGPALESIVRLSISASEGGVNSHGYASLVYELNDVRRRTFFVPKEAVSLLRNGAEQNIDSECTYSPVSKETVFSSAFFKRLVREIERSKSFSHEPAGDGSEYDAEEAEQERYKRLGVQPGSRFLNVGVDTQVGWPQSETVVNFDKYHLVLMPKTRANSQSIHIDLTGNGLTLDEAGTVINRFLSVMTWCDDQFAIAQDGWSGNPVPVAVPKRDLAFTTTTHWVFDRRIASSTEVLRALALYREGRNAEQNFMVSYAVLNYFKIIEIKNKSRGDAKNWFRDNFHILQQTSNNDELVNYFLTIIGNKKPHEYIYESCRTAVAHANEKSNSDPDDEIEIMRLHSAAEVIRILARHFIITEFRISEVLYSGD